MVHETFGSSTQAHFLRRLRTSNFPWISEVEPLIGDFYLPAIPDSLVENTELIAYPVSDRGDIEGGKRIHVTSSQSAQTAVTQSRLLFLVHQLVKIQSELGHCLTHRF